ncbi:MAG: hypothetical protein L7F78_03225 [Syntrophales bacterium LBB04]|nr:hypothetical protein [Syntrophales bacterium LBB04]
MTDRIEYTTPGDLYYDYCLWQYQPVTTTNNRFRSVNLLYHSFDVAGIDERAFALVDALRAAIGMFNTVWGIKQIGERLAWEFYFYDYRRRDRERSITKVLNAISPFIRCSIGANEHLYYFMFSIDINNDLLTGARDLDRIHMYIGAPGSTVSSAICYGVTAMGTSLENFYFFFDAIKQISDIPKKIAWSAHIDPTVIHVNNILWPELRDCRVIVVANKQANDAVYFSRINIDQLLFFLKSMRYPKEHVAYVEENRSKLDHLLFDVGFDYRMEGKDLVILKSGFYGIF